MQNDYIGRMQNIRLSDSLADQSQVIATTQQQQPVPGSERNNKHSSQQLQQHNHHPSLIVAALHPSLNEYSGYEHAQNMSVAKLANSRSLDNGRGGIYAQVSPLQQHPQASGGYFILTNSPTQSLSGSSQHSGSPRTSVSGIGINNTQQIQSGAISSAPVYENVDYYGSDPYYYESGGKKAQPQVPIGGFVGSSTAASSIQHQLNSARFAHTPQPAEHIESPPIYENIPAISGQRAQPQAAFSSRNISNPMNTTEGDNISAATVTNSAQFLVASSDIKLAQQQQQQPPHIPKARPTSPIASQSQQYEIMRPSLASVPYPMMVQRKSALPLNATPYSVYDYQKSSKYTSYLVSRRL